MENFAEYILNEKNYLRKIEIAYYLHKNANTFFDKSVICKTELARKFIQTMNIDVDENLVITACLLYASKKVAVATDFEQIKFYAKDGAEFLAKLGFDERFCRICEGVNRYSGLNPREPESDILELVDNLGGLLLNRSDRVSYGMQQAMELLVNKNLRKVDNRYMDLFKEFIYKEEGGYVMSIQIAEISSETTKNETVEKIQKANKGITSLFTFVNEEHPTIGAICRKYGFEDIQLRGRLN